MTDVILRVLDLETSGFEPTDKVVEIAAVDVRPGRSRQILIFGEQVVNPGIPIPPVTMAVHHITDDDVSWAPAWEEVWPRFMDVDGKEGVTAFVAHNAKFEAQFITAEMLRGRPLLCTYKSALRVWPEAPKHSNQVLRYWLKLVIVGDCSPPHRALPDANVTAHLVAELLKHATVEQMIEWSAEPALLPTINFGKHAGAKWCDVPADYLDWMFRQQDMDEDSVWNAKREMIRRDDVKRDDYAEEACRAAANSPTRVDLIQWFKSETGARERLGIVEGTVWYDRIVAACSERKQALPEVEVQKEAESNG